jgi:hypothetical protein
MPDRLVSVAEARYTLGGISRTTFYKLILPRLEVLAARDGRRATVKLGRRRMIALRYLEELLIQLSKVWWFLFATAALHVHAFIPALPGQWWAVTG